jgi:hypothetical protein
MIERRAVIGSTSEGGAAASRSLHEETVAQPDPVFHLLRYFGGIAGDWTLISGLAVIASW